MKRQHPIRKMRDAEARCGTIEAREKSLARHVKPLLDALEEVLRKFSISGDHEFCDETCEVKQAGRLLAEWRAKL